MALKQIATGAIFLLIGAILIWYALTLPCYIEPARQEVTGLPEGSAAADVTMHQPAEIQRLLCLMTDFKALIALLIGTSMIFPATGLLIKGVTEEKKNMPRIPTN